MAVKSRYVLLFVVAWCAVSFGYMWSRNMITTSVPAVVSSSVLYERELKIYGEHFAGMGRGNVATKSDAKPWLPHYVRRMKTHSLVVAKKRAATALHSAQALIQAIDFLEARGYAPMLRAGALLGALRHRGWIDFGGANYQSGFDNDPDGFLPAAGMADLLKQPASYFAPFTKRVRFTSLADYVRKACGKVEITLRLYTALGINLKEPYGFSLMLGKTVALDAAPLYQWHGEDSFIYPMCWTHVANLKSLESHAMRMRHDDVFPLRRIPFYNWTVPVMAHAEEYMKREWGSDVLHSVKIKQIEGAGKFSGTFSIPPGAMAPACPISTACASLSWHSEFVNEPWYQSYLNRRSVRNFPLPTAAATMSAECAQELDDLCERWWITAPRLPRSCTGVSREVVVTNPPTSAVPCSFFPSNHERSSEVGEPMVAACADHIAAMLQWLKTKHGIYYLVGRSELNMLLKRRLGERDGIDLYVGCELGLLLRELTARDDGKSGTVMNDADDGVWWRRDNCPVVRFINKDWVGDQLSVTAAVPDVCVCHNNGVAWQCDARARQRVYLQFGPAWRVAPTKRSAHSLTVPLIRELAASTGETLTDQDGMEVLAQLHIAEKQSP